jgi:hypothetical protein
MSALNYCLVFGHVTLLHRFGGGFEVGDIVVIALQVLVGRPTA